MASGDTKTEALLNILGNGGDASDYRGCCNTKTQSYILDAIDRVQNVEDEVEELKNNPDVVDIVNTYADLQAYDKSTLTDKDIIRVLEDSTHSNKSTYYRYSASTDSFTYIGEAGSGVNVVQTTGTSTTDVMSQNAVTSMVFADPSTMNNVKIGANTFTPVGTNSVEIGKESKAKGNGSIAIGLGATVDSFAAFGVGIGESASTYGDQAVAIGYYASGSNEKAVALGRGANANHTFSVALGAGATTSVAGEINVGTGSIYTTKGYNNSNYRLLTGLYDPQTAHDAATKGYVDSLVGNVAAALNAINNGTQS